MRRHPHRPDWIALGLYTATFTLICTTITTATVAVALIATGRLT